MLTVAGTPLVPTLAQALCRLVRGVPGAADEQAIGELVRLGLIEQVGPDECRDAERYTALADEGDHLRGELQAMRPPGGVAALVPGAAARFRERRGAIQAHLDAADVQRREVEGRYAAAQRGRWPLLRFSAALPDGACLLVTADGYRAADACWSGPDGIPEGLALRLAEAAGQAASLAGSLAQWRQLPPEATWLYATLLAGRGAGTLDTLQTLHGWLERQELWGDDPLPVAAVLAGAGDPGAAAHKAVEVFETLRGWHLGTGAEVFAGACRLAAGPTWIDAATRLENLQFLLRREEDLGLMSVHRALPLLAPLACLPRPAADTGGALRAVRGALRRRHAGAAVTLEVAAVLIAGVGFYCPARHEGQDLLSAGDPVADRLALRYEALMTPLREIDGQVPTPADRVEALAGAAATLPGSPERLGPALAAARQALLAAGAPEWACRAPTAIALARACLGPPFGLSLTDIAWELLRADEMTHVAWRALKGPGREVVPSFSGP